MGGPLKRIAQDQDLAPAVAAAHLIARAQPSQPHGLPHDTPIDALYLHVPFCFHKCHYCDFYSLVDDGDRQDAFVHRLVAELEWWSRRLALRPATLFVGGGTPTLLSPARWEQLLKALAQAGALEQAIEFTVEANPETVTGPLMATLVAGGVNRVSLGAQSFDPVLLKTLERWHEPASVARALEVIRVAGIDNVNLDLIFAIPGQTPAMLAADLEAALALRPTHLSCYGLTFEPNTALTQRRDLGRIRPVDEDTERDLYELTMRRLADAGFVHYEVSAWARAAGAGDREARAATPPAGLFTCAHTPPQPAWYCRHNLAYWSNRNWLGLGPSAGSHLDGYRWRNQPHLGAYLAGGNPPPVQDVEHLPAPRRLGEALMMGLRLRAGVDLAWLTGAMPGNDPRWAAIAELEHLGLLIRGSDRLRLTDRGLLVADAVLARLL